MSALKDTKSVLHDSFGLTFVWVGVLMDYYTTKAVSHGVTSRGGSWDHAPAHYIFHKWKGAAVSTPALEPHANIPRGVDVGWTVKSRSHLETRRASSSQSRWLDIDSERRALLLKWSEEEEKLAPPGRQLPFVEEQSELRLRAHCLSEIDTRLSVLNGLRLQLLRKLPKKRASTLGEIIENVAVAKRLVAREDNPQAYGLIARALRDLKKLQSLS